MGTANGRPIQELAPNLPNQKGWVSTEFQDYDPIKKVVVATYKTLDRLGRGGYGTVYKVQYVEKSETYALKCVLFKDSPYESATKEGGIMMKLQHPSIAKVHTMFPLYEGNNMFALCIIMDFVEGENLREYLRKMKEPLPKAIVMEWFIKILESISYLHEQKIFHRDIKPENIIIAPKSTSEFDVVLVDFGLARQQIHTQQVSYVAGTLPYLSPELQHQTGKALLSGKADVWALGCVLYEIWTLDSSFTGIVSGLAHRFDKDPRFLEKLGDPAIHAILSSMLERDPNNRISATAILSSEIIKGWKAAINVDSSDRNSCPETYAYLHPYVSILKDKKADPALVKANLGFLQKWCDRVNFCQALVDQQVAPILLELISTPDGFANFYAPYLIAYQICSSPSGIDTLIRVGTYTIFTWVLCERMGFYTLCNHFAFDQVVHKMLLSHDDRSGGITLFQYLYFSSIPLHAFLDALESSSKSIDERVSSVGQMLIEHEDISLEAQGPSAWDRLKKFLANFTETNGTERLLAGISNSHIHSCLIHLI